MATTEKRFVEAILPNLAEIVSQVDGEVLFQLSLDSYHEVIDIDCLASPTQPKNMVPLDLLLDGPRGLNAAAVAYVSTGTGTIQGPDDSELAFTARLIGAGASVGIPVIDHYLVLSGRLLSLKATTNLWD